MAEFQQTTEVIEILPDGTVRPSLRIIVSPEENEKAKQGYFCWHCAEDWSGTDIGAWPGRCPVCQVELTSEGYAALFQGQHDTGSRIDWAAEEDRLDRQGFQPRSGIWVPGNN